MRKRTPKAFRDMAAEHRRRLRRIVEQRGVGGLKKVYEDAITTVERKLAGLGSKKDTFTAHQYRLFLAQLRQGMAAVMEAMSGRMASISKGVQTETLRGLIGDIKRLEGKFTGAEVVLPIEEAARFQGVLAGTRESLLRAHRVSVATYGTSLIRKMEDQLSQALLVGEDMGEAIDRIMGVAGNEWWRAERIARTELIWTSNATQQQGIAEAAKELPDLMMRWTEHVSDTYRGLDNRVDVDSIALHGQVAPAGGVFHFPATLPSGAVLTAEQSLNWPKVAARFNGASWTQPPNRPNDRATLSPVRPHWGVPCWVWRGGRRVSWPGRLDVER